MKKILILLFSMAASQAWAAAPNDIATGQRAWFDGLDKNNVGYAAATVPVTLGSCGTTVTNWTSKINGYNLTQSIAGTTAPTCTSSALGIGANFDSTPDALSVLGDIWGGAVAVTTAEHFVITSSSNTAANSFLFASRPGGGTRYSAHFPWLNQVYLDPTCCPLPRNVGFTASGLVVDRLYLTTWNSSVAANNKKVLIDGTTAIMNFTGGVATYTSAATAYYSLGYGEGNSHRGLISEDIAYNRVVNDAERTIIHNYLSAKWGMAINNDCYVGDASANGLYRYHVGGIGQEANGSVTTGTSEGLTITNSGFLANGLYLTAGLPGLSAAGTMSAYNQATSAILTAPQQLTGTVTTNIPAGITWRGARDWYLDKTDATNSSANVTLAFNATGNMGISTFVAGDNVALLYRPNLTANYQVISTQSYNTGGTQSFTVSATNINDGYYTIGRAIPLLSNLKTVAVLDDPINTTTNPKYIPGATAQYTIRITNSGAGAVDSNTSIIIDAIPANTTLFTGNVSGGAPYAFINSVTPSSAISCPFTALNNLTDCIDFSTDNAATWAYVPNGSYDATVTHIRFKLAGAMAPATSAGSPYYEIKFNVQVK